MAGRAISSSMKSLKKTALVIPKVDTSGYFTIELTQCFIVASSVLELFKHQPYRIQSSSSFIVATDDRPGAGCVCFIEGFFDCIAVLVPKA